MSRIIAKLCAAAAAMAVSLVQARDAPESRPGFPESILTLLDNTDPLEHPRRDRLPLFLWPVHDGVVQDDVLQERIIRSLNQRGIAMIATWNWDKRQDSLADSMCIARIQQRLGLRVCVNANACMYGFFDGTDGTAHLDAQDEPFFDESIPGKIGCPFRIEHRFAAMREKIETFVRTYRDAGLPLDFVFGDWEIDGPLEINRAWEAAKRCRVCCEHIRGIEDFRLFQKAVRLERARATRRCYAEPILSRFPKALVGNYGVYPNDGFRYWYDYFEVFNKDHPHRRDQRATYREWPNDFPLKGYTLAMPVVYTWARIFSWYDFTNPDYRWFYNMLSVASNATNHTPSPIPVVPFVHWHTVFDGGAADSSVKQLSRTAYRELLWHMLLRGVDSFFMWCPTSQSAEEAALVHQVWADALMYRSWLDGGVPITHAVPAEPGPVISGLRMGERVLVRRSDFGDQPARKITLQVGNKTLTVPPRTGLCQVLELR